MGNNASSFCFPADLFLYGSPSAPRHAHSEASFTVLSRRFGWRFVFLHTNVSEVEFQVCNNKKYVTSCFS